MLQDNQRHFFNNLLKIPQSLFQLRHLNSKASKIQGWTTYHNNSGFSR